LVPEKVAQSSSGRGCHFKPRDLIINWWWCCYKRELLLLLLELLPSPTSRTATVQTVSDATVTHR